MDATDVLQRDLVIRRLRPADLEVVVVLDAKVVGRSRAAYLQHQLELNLLESNVGVSLCAEWDGSLVGYLLARVHFGQFGVVEPVAVLDTIAIHPELRGRGIGEALVEQLETNLRGLGVGCLRTEVSWDDQGLLAFFHKERFRPAERLCLEKRVDPAP